MNAGPNFVDPRGKLLPRAFDLLGNLFIFLCYLVSTLYTLLLLIYPFFFGAGLYATFIFQKPDPDLEPPLSTPIPFESSNDNDEASVFFRVFISLTVYNLFELPFPST